MKETAEQFGEGLALSGIITEPAGAPNKVGFLFLNAGIRHRVGPNRLHVTLARALARYGFSAMRFDFSGLGDSGAGGDSLSYEERINQEARAAMDRLAERCGVEHFVLYGLCSGADGAVRIALTDPRVAGLVLLQPYSFESPGYTVERVFRAALRRSTWARLLHGEIDLRKLLPAGIRGGATSSSALEEAATDPNQLWRMPPREEIVRAVCTLVEDGKHLLFVFSSYEPAEYNYRKILRAELERLKPAQRVQVEIFKDGDHTLSSLADQARLTDVVTGWARGVQPALS